ncbi:MAG: Gx transporter family protein [Atopobiaceae bacterium]|nr:Gx transporter family protein [Atopobiaceae bacterium]
MAVERTLTPEDAASWARAGMLAALAIVLGYLETFVPIPIPGVKLGLANIAILVALAQGDQRGAVAVGIIKVLASGLLFGNPLTMAYSAAGTALSLLVMLPLSHLETLHLAMLSVAGAVAHETGQLLVAQLVLGTPLVWYSAPPLLVAAVVTGVICGMVASRTVSLVNDMPTAATTSGAPPRSMADPMPADKLTLLAFAVLAVVTLRSTSPVILGALFLATLAACLMQHMSAIAIVRAIRPVIPIVLVTVVAQVATRQTGPVAFSLGPVNLTIEALRSSLVMVLRLVTIAAASAAVASAIPRERGIGLARWALQPASAFGADVAGPVLALDTAFALVPTMAEGIEGAMSERDLRLTSPELWRDVIPGVVAQLYTEAGMSRLA